MEYSDLVNAYKQFLAESTERAVDDCDKVVTVHETDWVQILFATSTQDHRGAKLVVELSLPEWVQELSVTTKTPEESANNTQLLRRALKVLVLHLEYLIKLNDAGFHLEIIAEEGFWTAWIQLTSPPSKQLFTVLQPPKVAV